MSSEAEQKQRRKETVKKYHKSVKYAKYMCKYWVREYERRKAESQKTQTTNEE